MGKQARSSSSSSSSSSARKIKSTSPHRENPKKNVADNTKVMRAWSEQQPAANPVPPQTEKAGDEEADQAAINRRKVQEEALKKAREVQEEAMKKAREEKAKEEEEREKKKAAMVEQLTIK